MKHRSSSSSKSCKSKSFEHKIQLQLADSLGFPVPNTQFWITLTITKEENKVAIQVPVINFQTGPVSTEDPIYPTALPFPGGYLYTSDGFLPKELRPNDLIPRSIVVASNNGMALPFSFTQPPPPLPTPPVGYILQVTNAGALQVQGTGSFGNIIPAGPQTLMPCSITYIVKPKIKLGKNYIIDPGFTNITQFTGEPLFDNIRDSHVNDVFDSVAAWAWTSNSNVVDKTNGTLNIFVAIGKVKKDGTLKIRNPIQLSDLAPNIQAWDTAVAINRSNKNNIVVSYGVVNSNFPLTSPEHIVSYRAVSFDGGKTWPINGPTNIQPAGDPPAFGDNRGVSADKFGNIWYSTTNRFSGSTPPDVKGIPTFWISTNGGVDFSVAYTAPPLPVDGDFYDYPQFCFGGDGQGNYGLWFVADHIYFYTGDEYPVVGFIRIDGLGSYDTSNPPPALLTSLQNTNIIAGITASSDGRVWTQGIADVYSTYIQEAGVIFKSPGPLDSNYAGPWQYIMWNGRGIEWNLPLQDSNPGRLGYFTSVQCIIYDDARQALYALWQAQFPDYSQNSRLYFVISRDNGQTWSDPIDISSTDFANRGFPSMALDAKTRNLVFGWYDGRNDPTFKSIQYFGAILTAKELDGLVEKIPLSNPLYTLPPATTPIPPTVATLKSDIQGKLRKARMRQFEKYFETKP